MILAPRLAMIFVLLGTLIFPALANAFETKASSAYVLDMTTGTVLLSKDPDIALPPASMSKLMTVNMLFEALKDGRVALDTRFTVSSRAKSMAGSTMFLNETDRPTVEELIQGIVVLSGNDATVVVAEGLAGTEDAFAKLMTERATAIGLTASTFGNASGWPDPIQRMSTHDLVTLASRIITEFPEYYGYFSETEFPFDGRSPDNRFNRNPLLKLGIGADGLKTGHTEEAGYGLVGSAVQGNRRIVFAITGLTSEEERSSEAESIVNWAFRQFVQKTVVTKGTEVTRADIWLGAEQQISLVAAEDISILVPALHHDGVPASITFKSPIEAPISEGQVLGEMIITPEGLPEHRVPLVAASAVEKGGFVNRLSAATSRLIERYAGTGS
jgi:serine-type D-Ala-D-Ala carboxypeptidase (penicillin-binding protein 5/6)